MGGSSIPKSSHYPVRSTSLPSRLNSHSIKTETELNKLKIWEKSLVPLVPISVENIKIGLMGLEDLYNCYEELFHSSLTQQALIKHEDVIEEALEGSITLLDSCTGARDLVTSMKENVRNLRLILRRKVDVGFESTFSAYTSCKKKTKETTKCLKALKQMKHKIEPIPLLDVNPYTSMVIRISRDVASITISILRSILVFLSMPVSNTKVSGWTLISKVMLTKPKTYHKGDRKILNEVQSVDVAMQSLHGCTWRNSEKLDGEILRKRLEALDHGLEGLEDGLDSLFRRLVKNMVSLLNLLAHQRH